MFFRIAFSLLMGMTCSVVCASNSELVKQMNMATCMLLDRDMASLEKIMTGSTKKEALAFFEVVRPMRNPEITSTCRERPPMLQKKLNLIDLFSSEGEKFQKKHSFELEETCFADSFRQEFEGFLARRKGELFLLEKIESDFESKMEFYLEFQFYADWIEWLNLLAKTLEGLNAKFPSTSLLAEYEKCLDLFSLVYHELSESGLLNEKRKAWINFRSEIFESYFLHYKKVSESKDPHRANRGNRKLFYLLNLQAGAITRYKRNISLKDVQAQTYFSQIET